MSVSRLLLALEHLPDPFHGNLQRPGQDTQRRDGGDPAAAFPPGDGGGGYSDLGGEGGLGNAAEEPLLIEQLPQLGFAMHVRCADPDHNGRCMTAATRLSTGHNNAL